MPADRLGPGRAALIRHTWCATALVGAFGVLFVIVQPAVRDSWAALARGQAVSEGVGLGYWFSWYSGGHPPGGYSVVVPWLSSVLGAYVVCAVGATAIPWCAMSAVQRTRHPVAAVWVSGVCATLNMWSGRVTFVVGSALGALAFAAAMRHRHWLAAAGVVLAGLASPVSVAFVLVGLGAGFLRRRTSLIPVGAGLGFLGASALLWGDSGPQGFGWASAGTALAMTLWYLWARPGRPVLYALGITAVAVIVVASVPNSLGMNLARLVFAVLPVAVVATARAGWRAVAIAVIPPLVWMASFTVRDIRDADAASSSLLTYDALKSALARQPGVDGTRVEVVADGTQTASYALSDRFWLARGWETQADRHLSDAFVDTEAPMTQSYLTSWLRDSSVGYVAINRRPVKMTGEWKLVHSHRPAQWQEVWNNDDWQLFRVPGVRPLVEPGARLVSRSPAEMVLDVDRPGTFRVRVAWNHFLVARSDDPQVETRTAPDAAGWTMVTTDKPGRLVLTGRA